MNHGNDDLFVLVGIAGISLTVGIIKLIYLQLEKGFQKKQIVEFTNSTVFTLDFKICDKVCLVSCFGHEGLLDYENLFLVTAVHLSTSSLHYPVM